MMSNSNIIKTQSEVETLLDKIFKVSTMADIEKYKEDLKGINEKMLEKIIPTLDYVNVMERTKIMFAAAIYLDSRAIIGTLKKELIENCDLAKLYIAIFCCPSEAKTVAADRYSTDTDEASENNAETLIAPLHEYEPKDDTLWSNVLDCTCIIQHYKSSGRSARNSLQVYSESGHRLLHQEGL